MKKIFFLFFLSVSVVFSYDVNIISQKNLDKSVTPLTIEKAFEEAGFFISGNQDMTQAFQRTFNESPFEVYNLFTVYHVDLLAKLAKEYPKIGLFTPLSMSIYTKKGEDRIHVAFLTKDAISKITKIPSSNADLKSLEMLVRKTLATALAKGEYEALEYEISKTDKELITKAQIQLDPKDWEEESETLIEEFEAKLEEQGFTQAGFTDANFHFQNQKNDYTYDLFVSESICKLPVIYTVAKTRPEAGAFAPCAIAMYKRSDDNTLYISYPNVYNWISSLSIEDKEAIDILEKTQKQMELILNEIKE